MFLKNGIAYAENPLPIIKVIGIRSLPNYFLWVRFNTGEIKKFDFKPYLNEPAFAPLKNVVKFNKVYIDYGVPTWEDGKIDMSPEVLYQNGILA